MNTPEPFNKYAQLEAFQTVAEWQGRNRFFVQQLQTRKGRAWKRKSKVRRNRIGRK